MILPADTTSIRSPVIAETPASASTATNVANVAQQALSNITQNAVGQTFQAQVLSQLEDGSFLVNVASNALRMALPAGTTVGDTLDMTLLSTNPRPAFLLEQQSSGTSASLSSAAKLISTVLQTAQQSGAPTALVAKAPLLTSPGAEVDTPKLATALQDSVEFSGLFYESHVSQWVSGERPMADLLREPQMQAPEEAAPQPATGKAPVDTAGTTVLQRPSTTDAQLSTLIGNVRATADNRSPLTQSLNTLLNNNDLPKEADVIVKSATITQENAQTINLQLNTLEQHRVAWQGELWPGQHMEWEVSEDAGGRSQSGGDESQPSWQSVVRFDLPSLGKISASVHLAGGHVRISVSTTSADSAATLKSHGNELASALDAAGSPLDSLVVKQDDQAA